MIRPASLFALLTLLALGAARAVADDRRSHPAIRPGGSLAALAAARASRAEWVLGALAVRQGREGGFIVRADLRYRGTRVARLREAVERALHDLEVGGIAWPGEHGRAWRFPLVYRGRVVGRLAVSRADGRLLADDGDDD